MEARLKLTVKAGRAVDLVLNGSPKAIGDLIERLQAMGGPLDVTGGQCCWSMAGQGATVHLVVDSEKLAS